MCGVHVILCSIHIVFFFKQKTAYEMRISDWSSDVCSSDLKDAWAFMDALDKNIAVYTHSGSKPCKQAAAGEYVIGISFDYRGAKSKSAGAPMEEIGRA